MIDTAITKKGKEGCSGRKVVRKEEEKGRDRGEETERVGEGVNTGPDYDGPEYDGPDFAGSPLATMFIVGNDNWDTDGLYLLPHIMRLAPPYYNIWLAKSLYCHYPSAYIP